VNWSITVFVAAMASMIVLILLLIKFYL
jgi:hypothetical protein